MLKTSVARNLRLFFAIAFPLLESSINESEASNAVLNVLTFIFTGDVVAGDYGKPLFGRMVREPDDKI